MHKLLFYIFKSLRWWAEHYSCFGEYFSKWKAFPLYAGGYNYYKAKLDVIVNGWPWTQMAATEQFPAISSDELIFYVAIASTFSQS